VLRERGPPFLPGAVAHAAAEALYNRVARAVQAMQLLEVVHPKEASEKHALQVSVKLKSGFR
jgi:hypothetical protein